MLPVFTALFLSASVGAAVPEPRPLALAREAAGLASSPDGHMAYFVAPITGRAELWRAPSAGGWPMQLTESGPVADPQLSPDGRSVVYAADAADGRGDLFLLPASGGAASNLTRSPARESAPRFSPDGRSLAYLSDAPGSVQLFVRPLDGPGAKALTRGAPVSAPPAWSPDGRKLACGRAGLVLFLDAAGRSTEERATGEERVLTVQWAPRGGSVLVLAESHGRRRMLLLRPGDARPRPLGPDDWDVRKAAWAGSAVVFLRREGDKSSLQVLERPGQAPRPLSPFPGNVEDFALDAGGRGVLAFLREGSRSLKIARLPVD